VCGVEPDIQQPLKKTLNERIVLLIIRGMGRGSSEHLKGTDIVAPMEGRGDHPWFEREREREREREIVV